MIKLETHLHTGGSFCADWNTEDIILEYKKAGYGGLVITNHYSESNFIAYGDGTDKGYVDFFFNLIDEAIELGQKHGLKIFYGLEVRINPTGTEYMLYGFDRAFLYDNPKIYDLTQKELFDLCNKYGIFMYQSHPFREGVVVGNPLYMHGAEGFNGHFHHRNYNAMANSFCQKNNLIKMSGTDFHHQGQPITSGIYIPEDINTNKQLTQFLFNNKFDLVQEKEYYIQQLIEYKKSCGIILDIQQEEI